MSDTEKFYLTTPIYYVNARPHLGTTYTTVVADTIARRKRALGIDTWFLTGTDEHGQKIERSANAAGTTPQQFVDSVAAQFRGLWDRLGLSYDDFIRTTEERHKRGVQKLFRLLQERGFIYKGTYTGQYCVHDEAFVDVAPGMPCPDCGRPTETVSEDNYFFKLSAFEHKLLAFYQENPGFIRPEVRRNEVISFVRSGLKDLSISRASFKWGIPVPGDERHVIYVWMDALANYITALGYGSDAPEDIARFQKYWPADLHIIGKEISRFHCVYWPAFLMAAGLPLPKSVVAHGWLLFEESKMSKSRGNIVRAETIVEVLGADAMRYFLLREVVFGQDGSFSFDALVQRYNADLANGYGNLVSRTLAMIGKYFEGRVPGAALDDKIAALANAAIATFHREFEALNFSRALESVWELVAAVDGYLTANAPWKQPEGVSDEAQHEHRARVLATAAEAIRVITALVYPVMPDAAAKVWAQLGLGDIHQAAQGGAFANLQWGGLQPGTQLGPTGPVFPRAEKDAIQRMQEIEDQNNTSKPAAAAEDVKPTTPAPAAKPQGGALPAAPSKHHHPSRLEAAIEGIAVALSESTSESAAVVALEEVFLGEPKGEREAAVRREAPAESGAQPASPAAATPAPPASEKITIDDFAKVELRVAQIKVAERIPKADKLLRLEVDLGYEQRQILAGIAEAYKPEDLIGRKVVIVANLAPRKLRGLESNGMIVAASIGEAGKPVLAGFLEDVEIGARLK
jgi:methionyl-tRNA synthetase